MMDNDSIQVREAPTVCFDVVLIAHIMPAYCGVGPLTYYYTYYLTRNTPPKNDLVFSSMVCAGSFLETAVFRATDEGVYTQAR